MLWEVQRENSNTKTYGLLFIWSHEFETFSGKNLIDNVLSMLEKYADNLEKLVEERTEQLLEERTKTENLLHQLLPR